MSHRALCCAAALASACASAPVRPIATPSASVAATSLGAEVRARLALLPTPPVPWETPVGHASRDALAQLCAFEVDHVGSDVIEARCANGTAVRVGGSVDACVEGRTGPRSAELLATCEMTVGELVACRIAVRETPCRAAGVGLPECDALRSCVDLERRMLEHEVEVLERIIDRGDEGVAGSKYLSSRGDVR